MAQRQHRLKTTACSVLATTFFFLVAESSTFAEVDTRSSDFPTAYPDLDWQPSDFHLFHDDEARYIDYESGSDSAEGSRTDPWKHHPWDKQATGKAATAKVNTYYFKKGVTYHGSLVADTSGNADQPVRLTTSHDWGEGPATISGSRTVNNAWSRCTPEQTARLPAASRNITWCTQIDLADPPNSLMKISDDGILDTIKLATTPNLTRNAPYDPRSQWATIDESDLLLTFDTIDGNVFSTGTSVHTARSKKHTGEIVDVGDDHISLRVPVSSYDRFSKAKQLTDGRRSLSVNKRKKTPITHILKDNDLPTGADISDAFIWIEPRRLPIPVASIIGEHLIDQNSFTARFSMSANSGPVAGSRYMLQRLPEFLDSAGEYAYTRNGKDSTTLYLRLPGDADPNRTRLEIGTHHTIIDISNQSHIEISGLDIRSNNPLSPGTKKALTAALYSSGIQIRGNVSDINIHHNSLHHLSAGIIGYPIDDQKKSIMDTIRINDNDISDIGGTAIAIGNGHRRKKTAKLSARLIEVEIMRNRIYDSGMLALGQRGALGTLGDAILIHGGEIVEIAHNDIDDIGGTGIQLVLGSEYARGHIARPFLRGLIHHNKVTDTLLAGYDFGGISAWTGGPVYIYNNISGNTVGYLSTHTGSHGDVTSLQGNSYGVGIYLDGVFKGYVFNNIIWGLENDTSKKIYNAAGINEAAGFLHYIFHNTLYKLGAGLHRGAGSQNNRNYYLSNALIDISEKFILQKTRHKENEYETLAFDNNIFSGDSRVFGQIAKGVKKLISIDFDRFKQFLKQQNAIEYDTGTLTSDAIVRDAAAHDFRPIRDSKLAGNASKVFVPWSLSRVVGEWHFYRNRKDPRLVHGENINMNSEWSQRYMFHQIPRNDLSCPDATNGDYVSGNLEDWTMGALNFDSDTRPCRLKDSALKLGYRWQLNIKKKSKSGKVSPDDRDTVDVGSENLIIEAVVRIRPSSSSQGLVSKYDRSGYELKLDHQGRVKLTLADDKTIISVSGDTAIDDDSWHHILVEVDRNRHRGISIYIDGKLVQNIWKGSDLPTGSLSNTADFIVGSSATDTRLNGQIDYLRIAKSTLRESSTSIGQLYRWQFDGPASRGFRGVTTAERRYAGAVETD